MSFCGRKTYIDANGKCHNISGMKVNEIKTLVNKTLEQVSDTSTRDVKIMYLETATHSHKLIQVLDVTYVL